MKRKLLIWTASVALTGTIICSSILTAFRFRLLYNVISEKTGVHTYVNLSEAEVRENYRVLIRYLMRPGVKKLSLPSFSMSDSGEIHFEEVKAIVQYVRILNVMMIALLFFGVWRLRGSGDIVYLKYAAISSIALPAGLGALISINLDRSFILFHKLFFRNDYWMFDPDYDPVIQILPEEVFYGYAFLILTLIAAGSGLVFLLYRFLKHSNRA